MTPDDRSVPPYLLELNPQQREAVEYLGGPQLVIAGAGSGKTRVITYKIVHLLENGTPPWRILALTFTNKAAREMRERIEALVGEETSSKLWMGTFHSIFSRILRANAPLIGFKNSFTIYDSGDSRSLIKTIIKEMALDDKIYKPALVQNIISNAKNALVTAEMYAADRGCQLADARNGRRRVADIFLAYSARCRTAGAMDFDDLLLNTFLLFRDHPEVCAEYRERFEYVLVDEYQDTNGAQHRIVEQIVGSDGRLCVVGDDAQSIYSFRGADIGNILHLDRSFPGLRIFKLERNYRSTRNIIDAAGSLIAKNRDQLPKKVYSENDLGDKIEVIKCYTDEEEAYKVAARVAQRRVSSGDDWSDFAILYRTNAQSRLLEESLRKRNIPYRIYGGQSFYQRKEVKDALAYFHMAANPDDDEAFRRIVNYPARGIGDTTVSRLVTAAFSHGCSLWHLVTHPELMPAEVKGAARRKLELFANLIDGFIRQVDDGVQADVVAFDIMRRSGMAALFQHDTTPENIARKENLEELLNAVRQHVESAREEGADEGLVSFLTTVSLSSDQDMADGEEDNPDRVTLMTVHAAKGLEFNNIFVAGVEEGLFPSSMSQDSQAQVDEERRLLYVAITRARHFCMMSYATRRFRNGTMMSTVISPFIRDIDPQYLSLSVGRDFASGQQAPYRPRPQHISPQMRSSARPLGDLRGYQAAPFVAPSSQESAPAKAPVPGEPRLHSIDELAVGDRIFHPRFGNGSILSVETGGAGDRMAVAFDSDDMPQRVLLLKYAKFLKI